ncbi:MAG: hypothetical protein HFG67_00930 [Firmicutes bacterium]|nr:hypothetical protein [Bacillota bacterium]
MSLKEEFIFDFAVKMPRILVSGNAAVLDNIQKVVLISGDQIIINSGKRFTAVAGRNLEIRELADQRMYIEGEIDEIRFYGTSQED